MGTNLNFRNFENVPPADARGSDGRPTGNSSLVRQTSVYSLTFDELQSTMGSIGKDFGFMNMDELLKNIWSAEETQNMGSTGSGGGQELGVSGGYLQRQGSLTLPRTLSQKTVDEVWKEISKEYDVQKDGNTGVGASNLPQRQRTLGEITLEDFLVRAGVVREDAQLAGQSNNTLSFGNLSRPGDNPPSIGIGFQQAGQNMGLMGNRIPDGGSQLGIQSGNLPLNVNGVRSTQQQLQIGQPQQQHQQQQQALFPKQAALAYGAPIPIASNNQLGNPGVGSGIAGMGDPTMNGSLVQNATLQGGGMGTVSLGASATGVSVAVGSPAISSDGLAKSNGDTSSVSPVPYAFNGGMRGRKYTGMEKVIERRQRRMIKNRESAARSRARKQAYTMELEAEITKLKEENEELQKKQEEMVEMMKNQVMEMMNMRQGGKRRCLRRTQTSSW